MGYWKTFCRKNCRSCYWICYGNAWLVLQIYKIANSSNIFKTLLLHHSSYSFRCDRIRSLVSWSKVCGSLSFWLRQLQNLGIREALQRISLILVFHSASSVWYCRRCLSFKLDKGKWPRIWICYHNSEQRSEICDCSCGHSHQQIHNQRKNIHGSNLDWKSYCVGCSSPRIVDCINSLWK